MFTKIIENCSKERRYQIGSWCITLRTMEAVSHPDIHFPSCLAARNHIAPADFTIWHREPGADTARVFQSLLENAVPIYPFGLQQFYAGLQEAGIKHLPFDQHCNRYYSCGDEILIDFPYSSDRFQIIFCRSTNDIFLFGPENSIRRILHDVCCIMAECLPIHGSAAAHGGKAVCFLGNSGSGKTFLLMNMLYQGYLYLADDELFLQDGIIHSVCDHIQLRPDPSKHFSEKTNTTTSALRVRTAEKALLNRSYILMPPNGSGSMQLFPCVARQSFWWLIALSQREIEIMDLPEKIKKSKRRAMQLLQSCTVAEVNFEQMRNITDASPVDYAERSYLKIRKDY
jgi:hypothetical protein